MYITSQFTDFAGQIHHFVVVGIIKNNVVSKCSRSIFIGVSICNPDDEFDVLKGIEIARARAEEKIEPVVTSIIPSYINATVLSFILNTTVERIKSDPGKFIKGYDEAKQKFIQKIHLINEINKFSDEEKCYLKYVINYFNAFEKCVSSAAEIKNCLNEEEIDSLFSDIDMDYFND